MRAAANIKSKFDTTTISLSNPMPLLLAANTFALLALDQMGAFPGWLKAVATMFLAF